MIVFLELLKRRNPAFIDAVVALHQGGALPSNTYVLDLDAVRHNATAITTAASALDLDVLAMTKQIGRNPDFCRTVAAGGITSAVAVDLECGWYAQAGGLRIGHLGHLVQIPRNQIALGLSLQPSAWTVFSLEQAQAIAVRAERTQPVYLRVFGPQDRYYRGHEGGFAIENVAHVAEEIDQLPNLVVSGTTSFPALLFDADRQQLALTPNAATIASAASVLEHALDRPMVRNMPGTTSAAALPLLADAGATQVEPGHALTGTTPLHAFQDLVELPAAAYVSEISHHVAGAGFVIGGGLYRDPVLGSQPTQAMAFAPDGTPTGQYDVEMPADNAIDYYCILQPRPGQVLPPVGSSVVFGFRAQAFVTRAQTVGITGVSTGTPSAQAPYSASGAISYLSQEVGR